MISRRLPRFCPEITCERPRGRNPRNLDVSQAPLGAVWTRNRKKSISGFLADPAIGHDTQVHRPVKDAIAHRVNPRSLEHHHLDIAASGLCLLPSRQGLASRLQTSCGP